MAKDLKSFVLRRFLESIPSLAAVIFIMFFMTHLSPGDPAVYLAGPDAYPETIEMLRHAMGLDKPLHVQFYIYLGNIIRGDLGFSFIYYRPVLDIILNRLSNTLLLMSTSYFISVILGIYLGVLSSKNPYSKTDNLMQVTSLIAYSVPNFWLGMIAILIFSLYLHLFPVAGMVTYGLTGIDRVIDTLRHLFLPMLVLGLSRLALIARFTRSSMLEVLGQDYILTAWSKGCDGYTVYYNHALKNALLPIITLVAMGLRNLFSGSILVENVFAWPGIGRLIYDAIFQLDYNMLIGIFFIIAIIIIISNLIADILYAFFDPRIRYG